MSACALVVRPAAVYLHHSQGVALCFWVLDAGYANDGSCSTQTRSLISARCELLRYRMHRAWVAALTAHLLGMQGPLPPSGRTFDTVAPLQTLSHASRSCLTR